MNLLSYAILRGVDRVAKALLDRGIVPLMPDRSGMTALHYAALKSTALFQSMLEQRPKGKPLPELRELWMALGKEEFHANRLSYERMDESREPLSPERFKELTGLLWRTFPVGLPEALLSDAALRMHEKSPFQTPDIFVRSFHELAKNPPPLTLRVDHDQFQVCADRPLEPGDPIMIPSGDVLDLAQPMRGEVTAYQRVLPMTSSVSGNLSRFIPHGFPNCAAVPVQINGVRVPLLVASTKIPAGTPLRIREEHGKLSLLPPDWEERLKIREHFQKQPPEEDNERNRYLQNSPASIADLLLHKIPLPSAVSSNENLKQFLDDLGQLQTRITRFEPLQWQGLKREEVLDLLHHLPAPRIPSIVQFIARSKKDLTTAIECAKKETEPSRVMISFLRREKPRSAVVTMLLQMSAAEPFPYRIVDAFSDMFILPAERLGPLISQDLIRARAEFFLAKSQEDPRALPLFAGAVFRMTEKSRHDLEQSLRAKNLFSEEIRKHMLRASLIQKHLQTLRRSSSSFSLFPYFKGVDRDTKRLNMFEILCFLSDEAPDHFLLVASEFFADEFMSWQGEKDSILCSLYQTVENLGLSSVFSSRLESILRDLVRQQGFAGREAEIPRFIEMLTGEQKEEESKTG
jgi:hypothetical protein